MTHHRKFSSPLPATLMAAIALLSVDAAVDGGARAGDYMAPYAAISGSISGSKLNIATINTNSSAYIRLGMSGRKNTLTARQSGNVAAIEVAQFGDDNTVDAVQTGETVHLDARQASRKTGDGRAKPSLQDYWVGGVKVTAYTSGEFGYFEATSNPGKIGSLGR